MPKDRVVVPAIGMIIAAILDLMFALIFAVLSIVGISAASMFVGNMGHLSGEREMMEAMLSGGFGIMISIFGIIIDLVIIFGALKMKQLKGYGLAVSAAILSIIPCLASPCLILGVPFGIWAMVVLTNTDVKKAFNETA